MKKLMYVKALHKTNILHESGFTTIMLCPLENYCNEYINSHHSCYKIIFLFPVVKICRGQQEPLGVGSKGLGASLGVGRN